MVLLKPGLLISSHVRERIKSRPLEISTIVVWTRKNEIPQTFSDEWAIKVIHINIEQFSNDCRK